MTAHRPNDSLKTPLVGGSAYSYEYLRAGREGGEGGVTLLRGPAKPRADPGSRTTTDQQSDLQISHMK